MSGVSSYSAEAKSWASVRMGLEDLASIISVYCLALRGIGRGSNESSPPTLGCGGLG